MADEKKVIFSVELKTDEASINKATTEMGRLNAEIVELTKSQKEAKKNGQENTQEFVDQKIKLAGLKTEYNEQNKVVKNYNILQKTSRDSLKGLKAQLSLTTNEINNLTKAERDDINVGGKLIKQQKQLSDQLKQVEKQGGNNTREVGNYSLANKGLGGTFASVGKMAKGFFATLMANPIGVIIGLIVGFVALMKKVVEPFQGILDWLSDKIAFLKGAVSGFLDSIEAMGNIIKAVFSGDFAEASKMASELAGNINDVADATEKLNQIMRESERQQKLNDATTARQAFHLKDLRKTVDDVNVSSAKRQEALKDLVKLQKGEAQDDYNNSLKIQVGIEDLINSRLKARGSNIIDIKKLSEEQLKAALKNTEETKITDDDYNKILDARIKTYRDLEKVSSVGQQAQLLRNKVIKAGEKENNILLKEQQELKKQDALLDKAKEKSLNAISKLENDALLKRIKGTENYYNELKRLSEEQYNNDKLTIEKSTKDKELEFLKLKELELKHNSDLAKIDSDFEVYKAEQQKIKDTTEEQLKAKKLADAQEIADNDKKLHDEEIQRLYDKVDLVSSSTQALNNIYQNIADTRLNLVESQYNGEKTALDKKLSDNTITEEEYNAQLLIMQNERIVKENEVNKKAFSVQKINDIAQIAINTALAVSKTMAQFGFPAGLIPAGLAVAQGGTQIAMVSSKSFVPKPTIKAQSGGKIAGDRHSSASGGVYIGDNVVAEQGEYKTTFINNRASTEKFEPLLEKINLLGNSNGDSSNVGDLIDYNKMAQAMQSKEVYIVSNKMTSKQMQEVKIKERTTI